MYCVASAIRIFPNGSVKRRKRNEDFIASSDMRIYPHTYNLKPNVQRYTLLGVFFFISEALSGSEDCRSVRPLIPGSTDYTVVDSEHGSLGTSAVASNVTM